MVFIFDRVLLFLKDHEIKIIQNFNSLRYSVLKISAFAFDGYHRFRTGAGVHNIFVGGVLPNIGESNFANISSLVHHTWCL